MNISQKYKQKLIQCCDRFGVEHVKSVAAFVITFLAGIIVLGGLAKSDKGLDDYDLER